MKDLKEIMLQIELHSPEGIQDCFMNGISANELCNGRPLFYELLGEYTRSPRFKECVRIFLDYGFEFENKAVLGVLADLPEFLDSILSFCPEEVHRPISLPCSYTPLYKVSLLHVCAEFNHTDTAKVLVKHGADINAKAGTDENGFGGHTPIFHTVNQNSNNSEEMLNFLLEKGADLDITVKGLIWGNGYDWETFIPSVNPISYAMMGLLPQMHRDEVVIAKIIEILMKKKFGTGYTPKNVPNKYLGNERRG